MVTGSKRTLRSYGRGLLRALMLLSVSTAVQAQNVLVNLAPIDGMDLTPDNILNYQVQSLYSTSVSATVKGSLHYRSTGYYINYSFRCTLQPGVNMFSADAVHPTWQYSSSPLRELFTEYKVLPQGTYEYCVSVYPGSGHGEGGTQAEAQDCLYRQSEDLFMITLTEPENNAKLYEYNPLLSWICTYPFVNALSYRVRVAEIKDGQNTANAISRNNPIYEERDVMQPSIVYPVYAKPLQAYQPYAWTVDAYYKGLLLGGAQPWRFMIVEDTTMVAVSADQSYYEFYKHNGETTLIAVGELKLKYVAQQSGDSLSFKIINDAKKDTVQTIKPMPMQYGDNLFALDVSGKLKHRKHYILKAYDRYGKEYTMPFIYYNPLYVQTNN